METSLVGITTTCVNSILKNAIISKKIPELRVYNKIRAEVMYGKDTRFDLCLENVERGRCYVEIKNCTLVQNGIAYFPDAVTKRGLKHLKRLQDVIHSGNDAIIFFLVQRMDSKVFSPATHIDPDYSLELRKAIDAGVKIIAYDVYIDMIGISLRKRLPCILS